LGAAAGTAVLSRIQAAPLACLRAPSVQNVGATGASVLWTLASKADARLDVIDDAGFVQSLSPEVVEFAPAQTGLPASYFQYKTIVADLKPDTSYRYTVRSSAQPGASLSGLFEFRTASKRSAFRFLHFADSGTGTDAQLRLAAQMAREDPAFVLANGDLAYENATHASVEDNYFSVYRDLMARVPFFATLGNHEYYTDSGRPSLRSRVTPTAGIPERDWGRYYSFDWGNAHFVALDSNDPLARADEGDFGMLTWLENDLKATRKFWRIVFFHHAPYSTGIHQDEPETARVRKYIVPILERHGVQVVFSGHEHTYQRTLPLSAGQISTAAAGGIVYITSGGGGQTAWSFPGADWIAERRAVNHFIRADLSGGSAMLSAVTAEGVAVDSVGLKPAPRFTTGLVNAATFAPGVASGGLATIFGWNLCVEEMQNGSAAFQSAGTSVKLGGLPVPMLYADANQINVQIPFGFSGAGTLEVRTPNGIASFDVSIAPVAPAIFSTGSGQAVAQHADGSLVSPDAPARSGEIVTLMVTGLGAVSGTVEAGSTPPSALPVGAEVRVRLAGNFTETVGASLGTQAPGVYEVQVRVPAGLSAMAEIEVFATGVRSNTAMLAIA
jgi:uncharacterized protein (TIGR03437 family)